ncbi:MAG: sensor histidine kinase [Melioribacteraceae bacterium]
MKTKLLNAENIHLHKIIHNTIKLLEVELTKKDISLVSTIEKDLPAIIVDQNEVTLLIKNLLSNAIQYNKTGGKIFVDVIRSKNSISIGIKDTGIGMRHEELTKIFNEYYRIKNNRMRGISVTNHGLTIVKQIVDSYHGKVDVESVFGEGTTVTINLPINTN